MTNSRLPGFHHLSLAERRALLKTQMGDAAPDFTILDDGGISPEIADKIVENVLGVYALPFSIALNVQLNGRDRLAPLVVEEPSVVAAASNAAKMVRAGGGFLATTTESIMIGQIELRRVTDVGAAIDRITAHEADLLTRANDAFPSLVRRRGGARGVEVRRIGDDHLVVHLLVDTLDAMGANLVNTAAEAIGPYLAEIAAATLGLRILSNLSDRRLVRVTARVPGDALVASLPHVSASEALDAIEAASVFAERDPYRAATHNKGIMNGLDSVVIATGNDYRAVEAGAHAYAARSGVYSPLATWRRDGDALLGTLELPLALGTVGGTLRVHPGARLALALGSIEGARDLAELAASVGLASNLAALRALATEGIQRGHMSLHVRSLAISVGAQGAEVDRVAELLRAQHATTEDAARRALAEVRKSP